MMGNNPACQTTVPSFFISRLTINRSKERKELYNHLSSDVITIPSKILNEDTANDSSMFLICRSLEAATPACR